VLVLPSPKFQSHAVGEPVEVSVNCTVRGVAARRGAREPGDRGISGAGPVRNAVAAGGVAL